MSATKYKLQDWKNVKKLLSLGMTIRATAAETGVDRNAVLRWSHMNEPPEWMWYTVEVNFDVIAAKAKQRAPRARLGYEDRAYIAAQLSVGKNYTEIAHTLGVSRSTVSREVNRCSTSCIYDPKIAHADAKRKAKRPKMRKIDANPQLRKEVVKRLCAFWSPREVAATLKRDFPDDDSMNLSHEAIYQAIYIQGKGSLRQEIAVEKALRSGRIHRIPQSKMPARPRGKSWVEGCEISTRPPEIEDRAIPGHWEGDLIIGSDMASCLVTLVERKSRFLVARRLDCHDTKTVVDLLVEMSASIPDAIRDVAVKSLTWDQGCEMADAARFTQETGFKVYFCDPHSPWQKGTNENTNGLIRQYFPKGTSFLNVTDEDVLWMQNSMNERPRETLQWMSPAEVLNMEFARARAMTA